MFQLSKKILYYCYLNKLQKYGKFMTYSHYKYRKIAWKNNNSFAIKKMNAYWRQMY